VATVSISGTSIVAPGNGGLTAEQRFQVIVANRAPVPVGTIRDRKVEENDTAIVDVAGYFRDPDGDRLTYDASSGCQREALPARIRQPQQAGRGRNPAGEGRRRDLPG